MTKVSVIIPVYNAEKYLKDCLDSLVNQTLKEKEIICVNDGSTDSSLEILQDYANNYEFIKIIDKENKGAGHSRNVGIEHSTGKYLSFLDADDFFESTMLEKAYKTAEKEQAEICVYKCDLYDNINGKFLPCPWSFKEEFLPQDSWISPRKDNMKTDIFRSFVGWAWDKLFLKEFIIREGILFQELRTTNDMFFVDYALTRANKIALLREKLVHQRVNLNGSLSNTREKSWDCFYYALLFLKKKLEENGDYEFFRQAYVNWALNLSLWHLYFIADSHCMKVFDLIKTKGLVDLDLIGHDIGFYFDRTEYENLQKIVNGEKEDEFLDRLTGCRSYIQDLQNELKNKDLLIKNRDRELKDANRRIADLYTSKSYRIGNLVLFVPKKLKKIFMRDHG